MWTLQSVSFEDIAMAVAWLCDCIITDIRLK